MNNKYKPIETEDQYFIYKTKMMNLICDITEEDNPRKKEELAHLTARLEEWDYQHEFEQMLRKERMMREVQTQLDREEEEDWSIEKFFETEMELMEEIMKEDKS